MVIRVLCNQKCVFKCFFLLLLLFIVLDRQIYWRNDSERNEKQTVLFEFADAANALRRKPVTSFNQSKR